MSGAQLDTVEAPRCAVAGRNVMNQDIRVLDEFVKQFSSFDAL
jgi:hypothetical protein